MKIEILDSGKKPTEWVKFVLEGVDVSFANAMRQALMTEIPVLAIEDVTLRQNSSALYDEMLALRLGLIPIKTDNSFILRTEASGDAQFSVMLSLKEKGPKWVYSGDLTASDKKVSVVFDEIPITYLGEGQELDLDAVAVTGLGREHTKWQAGFCFFQNYPKIVMEKGSSIEFSERFAAKDLLVSKDGKIKDLKNWNAGLAKSQIASGARVEEEAEKFIFHLESFGQMPVLQMVGQATERLSEKFSGFAKTVDSL
jgi:DNA-directed RNA polymerase subunit D